MAVKKHRLDLAIEEDFCLLGMVSDEPDYRLCWLINRETGTGFDKQEDLDLYHARLKTNQLFSIYLHVDQEAMLTYRIIRNRADRGYFLDELKNLDYLVHIQGELYQDHILEFIRVCSGMREVRMCIPVELNRIRNKERLLLW